MKKKTVLSVAASTLVTTLAVVGVTYAATPAANDTSLLNRGTVEVDSLKVGKQGTGGVTFFNGTIVNNTTENGVDNPVTFGDDVRIDGRVYRGATAGTGDSQPFIINDNAEVAGSLEVGGTDVFAEIATKANSSDVYTKTQVDSAVGAKANSSDVYTKTESDTNFVSKSGTKYLNIPSSAFMPGVSTHAYQLDVSSLGLEITAGTNVDFYAPVDLPDGATITNFGANVFDNGANTLSVDLFQDTTGTFAGNPSSIASLTSSGASALIQNLATTTISDTSVDNQSNTLFVRISFSDGTDMELYNAFVAYTL